MESLQHLQFLYMCWASPLWELSHLLSQTSTIAFFLFVCLNLVMDMLLAQISFTKRWAYLKKYKLAPFRVDLGILMLERKGNI